MKQMMVSSGYLLLLCLMMLDIHIGLLKAKTVETKIEHSRKKRSIPFPHFMTPSRWRFPFLQGRVPEQMPFPFPGFRWISEQNDFMPLSRPGLPDFQRIGPNRGPFMPTEPFPTHPGLDRLSNQMGVPQPFVPRDFGFNPVGRQRMTPMGGPVFRTGNPGLNFINGMTRPGQQQTPNGQPPHMANRGIRENPSFGRPLLASMNMDPRSSQFRSAVAGTNTGFSNPIPHCFGSYVQHCRLLLPAENPNNAHRCRGNCPGRTCFVNCLCTCELPQGQGSRPLPTPRGTAGQGFVDVMPPRVPMTRILGRGRDIAVRFQPIGIDGANRGQPDVLMARQGVADALISNPTSGINILENIRPRNTETGVFSNVPLDMVRVEPEVRILLASSRVSPSTLGVVKTGSDVAYQAEPLTDETLAQLLSGQDLNFLLGPSGVNSIIDGEPPVLNIPILSHSDVPLPELGMAEIHLNLPEPEIRVISANEADARRLAARAGVGGQGSVTFRGGIQLGDSTGLRGGRQVPASVNTGSGVEGSTSVMRDVTQATAGLGDPSFERLFIASLFGDGAGLKTDLPLPRPAPAPPIANAMLPLPSPIPAPPLATDARAFGGVATSGNRFDSPLVSINSALANTVSVVKGGAKTAPMRSSFVTHREPGNAGMLPKDIPINALALLPGIWPQSNPTAPSSFEPMIAHLMAGATDTRTLDSTLGPNDALKMMLSMAALTGNSNQPAYSADSLQGQHNGSFSSGATIPNPTPSNLQSLVSILRIPTPLTKTSDSGFKIRNITGSLGELPFTPAPESITSGSVTNSSGLNSQPNVMQSFLTGIIRATDPQVKSDTAESCRGQRKELWCDPVGVWGETPGLAKWCLLNCQTSIDCDRKRCACMCVDEHLFRTKYEQLSSKVS